MLTSASRSEPILAFDSSARCGSILSVWNLYLSTHFQVELDHQRVVGLCSMQLYGLSALAGYLMQITGTVGDSHTPHFSHHGFREWLVAHFVCFRHTARK